MNDAIPLPGALRKCPICGKTASSRHTPFCSSRCANIDLGRWLKESYRVKTDEGADDAGGEARED